ncbi:capsid protein [Northern red-backed vole stool-associated circular virus 68]|nr:capsid protein [Northern red-backed vole stool-associated circular virus 68]
MNGRYRSRKSLGSYRSSASRAIGYPSRRTAYTAGVRSGGSRFKRNAVRVPKFAVRGYAIDTEKKYFDKAIKTDNIVVNAPTTSTLGPNAVASASGLWSYATMPGSATSTTTNLYVQDLLKGLPQGTNATSRIGNVINVKYIKGNITLTANTITNATTGFENAQYGEAVIDDVANVLVQYVRTTYRVAIVRDLQVNSTAQIVSWGDVFSGLNGTAGVHSELNVANMGRFRILMDKLVNLDADDPMKTIPYLLKGVGNIRYNGTETLNPDGTTYSSAMTDNGIYVIWACLTTGTVKTAAVSLAAMQTQGVVVNSRICFTDS